MKIVNFELETSTGENIRLDEANIISLGGFDFKDKKKFIFDSKEGYLEFDLDRIRGLCFSLYDEEKKKIIRIISHGYEDYDTNGDDK